MRKFKMFVDVQKEEKWLNNMAADGFECIKIDAFGYVFQANTRHKQTIRIDTQKFNSAEAYEQYKALYKDYGWMHLQGTRWSQMQYWKGNADENDTLFSDTDSKITYYQRILNYYAGIILIFSVLFVLFIDEYTLHPKAAYFTPGLWEKTGLDFLTSFLFETPFALVRFASPWFMLIFILCYLYVYVKYKQYQKSQSNDRGEKV